MESRSGIVFRLIFFLEIFVIIFLIFTLIFLYQDNRHLTRKASFYKLDFDVVNYSDIDNEITKYENLDKSISDLYETYYSNINLLEKKIIDGKTNVKIAYLTFDDGPYALTSKYLDLLKQNNVRATFFVLGKEGFESTYRRIVNDGHTLANHTFYHNISGGLYSSSDNFINQVVKLENFLLDITGYKTTIVRMPGGSSTAGSLKNDIVNKLHQKGYKYVDWNCETGDGASKKLAIKDNYTWFVDTKADQKIIVLLMHDYNNATYESLQRIIDTLKEENFIFLPLTNKSIMTK